MAVKIKLKRMGKIRAPFYRIIVADARTKRDGRAIEEIGKYHPKVDPSLIEVNSERAQYWLSVGAQPTDPVRRLLEITGDWQKFKGLPGAEGTLKTIAPKADKKEVFAAAVAETVKDLKVKGKPGDAKAGDGKAAEAKQDKGKARKPASASAKTANASAAKDAAAKDSAAKDSAAGETATGETATKATATKATATKATAAKSGAARGGSGKGAPAKGSTAKGDAADSGSDEAAAQTEPAAVPAGQDGEA